MTRYGPGLRYARAISLRRRTACAGRGIGEISRYEGGIQFARLSLTGFNGDIAENRANSLRNQRFCNAPPNAGCCSGDQRRVTL